MQGQICDILRPQLAMNCFLALWPYRYPHFEYIILGGGGWGALILDRCRAFDLFASVDAHLWWPARQHRLAGWYDNPKPESTTVYPPFRDYDFGHCRSFRFCSFSPVDWQLAPEAMLLLYDCIHKVLTYVECRAVSGVIQNIDPPPPIHPASVSSPAPKAGGSGGYTLAGR